MSALKINHVKHESHHSHDLENITSKEIPRESTLFGTKKNPNTVLKLSDGGNEQEKAVHSQLSPMTFSLLPLVTCFQRQLKFSNN